MQLTPLHQFTVLQFTGAKAQDFLQGQLTCDMQLLSLHGQYSMTSLCDHRGRMIMNGWILRWHDDYWLVLPKSLSQTVQTHLQKYAIFSKVTITELNTVFIAELQVASLMENCPGMMLISHNRYVVVDNQNRFTDATIQQDATAWIQRNIADELCILYPETSLQFTPQMINLGKWGALSFTKGCYVGQEIVARTEHLGTLKRHLHRMQRLSETSLKPGDILKNNEEVSVGMIVEAIPLDNHHWDLLAVIQDHAIDLFK